MAKGGYGNAGIGSGQFGICGNITIKSGNITAQGGSSCDGVTIDGVAGATTSSTFPHLTSAVSGDTWTLTQKAN